MKQYFFSLLIIVLIAPLSFSQEAITKYVRYSFEGKEAYGILKDNTIHELQGDLFSSPVNTGNTHSLSEVKLTCILDVDFLAVTKKHRQYYRLHASIGGNNGVLKKILKNF